MLIEISGVTNGTGPYDVYLCTWDLLSCFYVSGVTTIPPNIIINSDNYFPNLELLKLKIVDNYGCVEILEMPCQPTPTPTATPTPTPTPYICSDIILLEINGGVYRYDQLTNTKNLLFTAPSGLLDTAHDTTKLWINSSSTIREYDIILTPWSQTLNRLITSSPVVMGNGLASVPGNNTKLITTDTSRTPHVLVELDITTTTATYTDITTLPVGAINPGDIIVTNTTPKKILINLNNVTSGANGLYQYDYSTGVFENYVSLGLALSSFGLYEDSTLIYLVGGGGQLYSLSPLPPYTLTFIQTISTTNIIVGASQLPNCSTIILPTATPTPTPTPTATPTPTPTPTPTATPLPCYCYTLEGLSPTGATFGYHDCSSAPQTSVVGRGVTINVCMSTAPILLSGNGASAYYGLCSGGVCPP